MGLLRALIFIGIAAIWLAACRHSDRSPSSSDGATDIPLCRENFADPPACSTNFSELIAHRSELSNKKISLIGYVGQDDGLLVVYPSEQAYAYRNVSSALSVRGAESEQLQLLKDCAYKYCAINGIFRGTRKKEQSRYFGSIRPDKHLLMRIRAGVPEPLKMQSEDVAEGDSEKP